MLQIEEISSQSYPVPIRTYTENLDCHRSVHNRQLNYSRQTLKSVQPPFNGCCCSIAIRTSIRSAILIAAPQLSYRCRHLLYATDKSSQLPYQPQPYHSLFVPDVIHTSITAKNSRLATQPYHSLSVPDVIHTSITAKNSRLPTKFN